MMYTCYYLNYWDQELLEEMLETVNEYSDLVQDHENMSKEYDE